MKRVLQLFLVILGIQIILFFLGWPEYIPSLEPIIDQTMLFSYIGICILFLAMVAVMIVQYSRAKQPFVNWLKPIGLCLLSLIGIFIGSFAAMGRSKINFLWGHTCAINYTYKGADATIFVYDESFLTAQQFSIGVRNGKLPIVKEIYRSKNTGWYYHIKIDSVKDCLYIYENGDTLSIDSKQIMKY